MHPVNSPGGIRISGHKLHTNRVHSGVAQRELAMLVGCKGQSQAATAFLDLCLGLCLQVAMPILSWNLQPCPDNLFSDLWPPNQWE